MNRRFLMRSLRNRLEKTAGSQSRLRRDQDPAKRTFGTTSKIRATTSMQRSAPEDVHHTQEKPDRLKTDRNVRGCQRYKILDQRGPPICLAWTVEIDYYRACAQNWKLLQPNRIWDIDCT